MVNVQTWLNEKFPNEEAKKKVNKLCIYTSNGTEFNNGQNCHFYNTKLEGELDLSDFINLNYCCISNYSIIASNYHKLNLLKLDDCSRLNQLYLEYNDGQLSFRGNIAPNNFYLRYCQNLSDLKFSDQFANTKNLNIQNCQQLTTLSKLDRLVNLNTLYIDNNLKLTILEGLSGLEELQTFTLCKCSQFDRLTGLDKLISLRTLNISGCPNLDLSQQDIPAGVTSLSISDINGPNFASFSPNQQLRSLSISDCSNLQEISDIDKLTGLSITNCSNLEKINGFEYAAAHFNFQNCPKLKPFKRFGELKELSSLIFPNSTYNFANLKEEIKRLKINDLTPLFQNKSRELKELITNVKSKLSEEAQELPEAFLELHMELARDTDNNFLQKQLERMKNSLNKKLSEQEINSLTDKQTEVIKLKKQLENLQIEITS